MSRIYTIATAGHVDHGKSALVRAMTGMEPDRLAEEKRREMTIDLGFAWLTLPGVGSAGIIDVPGHHDFIENMLAGIGGIDAVMLVIAADEGIMPQTREHLTILDLLGVSRGLVALTKIDLADDQSWLTLVEDEIRHTLEHTTLSAAPIIPVSALTGAGFDDLRAALAEILQQSPPPLDSGHPRLPIDRVFTLSGFGTVVTGTLRGGSLRAGEEVELLPGRITGRIRGLQNHKQSITQAQAGVRTAANLAGISHDQISRGMVLTRPGQWQTTSLIDARLTIAKSAIRALKHQTAIKFHWGSAAINGYVRLLDADEAEAGAVVWSQLVLEQPLALADGDRFILRIPSPEMTIAGGSVADSHPARRWRRRDLRTLTRLAARAEASPAQYLAHLAAPEPIVPAALRAAAHAISPAEFDQALKEALASGSLVQLPSNTLISAEQLDHLRAHARAELTAFHESAPLRLGMPREALRSRLNVQAQTLEIVLSGWEHAIVEHHLVRLAEHRPRLTGAQETARSALMARMREALYTPPSYTEAVSEAGDDIVQVLLDAGEIVRVQAEVILSREAYEALVAAALAAIDAQGSISASELRDQFQTSRKYAIALLEHLDSRGVTRRRGDLHVRGTRG